MTQNSNKREALCGVGCDEAIVFDNPDYDDAIIGYTIDCQAVYDYELMVLSLMEHDEMTEEDAVEFLDYNTFRVLPYAGENAPIIMIHLPEP